MLLMHEKLVGILGHHRLFPPQTKRLVEHVSAAPTVIDICGYLLQVGD